MKLIYIKDCVVVVVAFFLGWTGKKRGRLPDTDSDRKIKTHTQIQYSKSERARERQKVG